MKGIVFNLLEEVVIRHHGEDVWDTLLDAAGLDGNYTSLGSYPDEDMGKLVAVAATALNISAIDVQRWFGRQAMPLLVARYPAFFTPHQVTRTFIVSVNSIIHPEVRKVYPGADVPTFDFTLLDDGGLLMGYTSPRRLCALAEGFIEGAADHFHESAHAEHVECMHRGDAKCLVKIAFRQAA